MRLGLDQEPSEPEVASDDSPSRGKQRLESFTWAFVGAYNVLKSGHRIAVDPELLLPLGIPLPVFLVLPAHAWCRASWCDEDLSEIPITCGKAER